MCKKTQLENKKEIQEEIKEKKQTKRNGKNAETAKRILQKTLNKYFKQKKMTTVSRKLRHTAEASLTVFTIVGKTPTQPQLNST